MSSYTANPDHILYYDTYDVADYLTEGENAICALVWYCGDETSYSYHGSGQGGFLFEAIGEDISIVSDNSWRAKRNPAYIDSALYPPNYRLPEYSIYFDARKDMIIEKEGKKIAVICVSEHEFCQALPDRMGARICADIEAV